MPTVLLQPFNPDSLVPDTSPIPADRVLQGQPVQTVWSHYEDPDGRFFTGLWEATPGKWRIRYTENEYCRVLAGVSVIADEAGHARRVEAGDEFVVPRGFAGTWEVVETTRKVYVIHEPGEPAA